MSQAQLGRDGYNSYKSHSNHNSSDNTHHSHNHHNSHSHYHQTGFTLIEVMVALAILAAVAIVASQASSTYLRSVDNLKLRTLAHFVAQNTAATLQLNPQSFAGLPSNQGTPMTNRLSSQGHEWQVTLTPLTLDEVLAGSSNVALQALLLPVSIQVAPISPDSGQVQHSITDLTVMIGKPNAQ